MLLQDCDWELIPWQSAPPPAGDGFVQLRMRVCDPPPQVTVQPLQLPQTDHPPLTWHIEEKKRMNNNNNEKKKKKKNENK